MNQLFEKMISKADNFFNNWAEQLYFASWDTSWNKSFS